MPDRDVTTIEDLIYYQYAKLIASSTFHEPEVATTLPLSKTKNLKNIPKDTLGLIRLGENRDISKQIDLA